MITMKLNICMCYHTIYGSRPFPWSMSVAMKYACCHAQSRPRTHGGSPNIRPATHRPSRCHRPRTSPAASPTDRMYAASSFNRAKSAGRPLDTVRQNPTVRSIHPLPSLIQLTCIRMCVCRCVALKRMHSVNDGIFNVIHA